jgi:hypothetical protein
MRVCSTREPKVCFIHDHCYKKPKIIYIRGAPQSGAPRICLPPFSRGWAHTYPWRMYMWCATGMHIIRGALQMHAPRIWGPDTPGHGARWGPLIYGASFPWCATGKMISVEHLYLVRHGYLSVEHRN